MKKLFFFFSTLFVFLIPHAKAEFAPATYFLRYNNNSINNFYYNTVQSIKDTSCTYSYCRYGGSSKSVLDNLETLIDELEALDYTFVINIGHGDSRDDVSSLENIYIYIIDTDRSSDKIYLYPGSTSLSYLNFTLSSRPINSYNQSSGVYAWTIGPGYFENYDVSSISSYIGTEYSSLVDIDLLRVNTDSTGNIYYDGYSLYYTNLHYEYRIEPFGLRIFTDRPNPDGNPFDMLIDDNHGWQSNKYQMLSFYATDYFGVGTPTTPGGGDEEEDNPNQGIEDGLGDLNDSINSSDISGSEGAFNDFFGNFESDDHGLFAIISTPLNFIKSFLNSVCTPLVLPLPFVDTDVTLPCMEYVYTKFFGNFFTAYQTITTGIVAYWVCINILRIVKDMKDSEKDTIEVLDL